MKRLTAFLQSRRTAALLLALLLTAALLPCAAHGLAEEKTVRVGWFESAFNRTDKFGRRTGYAYEYQHKIAAYTGWDYTYVQGSWPELLQMLKDGEIDLLSDVSYTPERDEQMLFASLPMGTEAYYIFTAAGNPEIRSEDYGTLNGKKIGVNRDSVQKDMFVSWAHIHGIEADLVELTASQEESLVMLCDGRLDAYITLSSFADPETATPLWKIGSSDFYFAVSKSRPDLQRELETAMSRIQDENLYYNLQLYEKYFHGPAAHGYLSAEELEWIAGHGTIRVGYQDNYLAFCAADPATGELTGALKDVLAFAASGLENVYLDFEPVSFPTASAAIEAMKDGEVDCVFPANLTDYDSEVLGVVMTPALMRTEMDAVVRAAEQKEFIRKQNVTVAVNEGNTNYDMFLADHYPGWNRAYFKDTPTGLDAVAAGKADCVIISNYRFGNISKQCEKLHLTTVYTGVDMDYCFAVRKGDTFLYSILSKVVDAVPDATIHSALTYYSTEDVKTSFGDLIKDNLFIVMSVIAAVLLVILILLLRGIRAERRASEEHHQVDELNKRVYVDALTSVRNKGGFDDYIRLLQEQAEQDPEFEYAIGVFDCNNLKHINDHYGHDKGDAYLKSASRLICRTFQHSPVFRIGGDEFAIVLQNEDYENRDALVKRFEAERRELCDAAEQPWEEVHIAMGLAVFDPMIDDNVNDTVRRADRCMYENKRLGKARQ